MNSAKLAYDFLVSNLTLENLAEKYSVDKADIVKSIRQYCKATPSSNLSHQLERKLKVVLTKRFLSCTCRRDDFAASYGMKESDFVSLIKEIIEDTSLIPYDTLANKLFMRLTLYKIYSVASVPKRIVRIIAEYYVKPNEPLSQENLASMYGINYTSISRILRRSIAEDIVNDETANKIYSKVLSCKYSEAVLKLFDKAFDQREQLTSG